MPQKASSHQATDRHQGYQDYNLKLAFFLWHRPKLSKWQSQKSIDNIIWQRPKNVHKTKVLIKAQIKVLIKAQTKDQKVLIKAQIKYQKSPNQGTNKCLKDRSKALSQAKVLIKALKRPLKSVVAGKSPNQGTKKTAQKALSQAKSPNQGTNKCLKRPNQRHQQKTYTGTYLVEIQSQQKAKTGRGPKKSQFDIFYG